MICHTIWRLKMIFSNKISVIVKGDITVFSKIVGGKILFITKYDLTAAKLLFWAEMFGTMTDLEWNDYNISK